MGAHGRLFPGSLGLRKTSARSDRCESCAGLRRLPLQFIPHRPRQCPGTGTSQPDVGGFQAADEIEHFGAGIRATRRRAKMGPATKGTVPVDHTGPVFAQHRTRAILPFRHRLSSRSAQGPRGQDRLAPRKLRRPPRELEMATLGETRAGTPDRTAFQLAINGADFFQRLTTQRLGRSGRPGMLS